MNLFTWLQTISKCILVNKLWSLFAKKEVCEDGWGQWAVIDELKN